MTVPIETSRVEFTGNGVTTVFGTTFDFDTSAQLVVKLILISTGAETIQTLGTHYTVSGGSGLTGNVTMLTAPSSLNTLRVERDVAIVQDTDFPVQGVAPVAVEAALDHLTWVCQQLAQRVTDLEAGASDTTVALAGNGLTKSGDTLHVGAGTGIVVGADTVGLDYTGDPPEDVIVQAASGGTAPDPARIDHLHNVVTAAPAAGSVAVGNAAAAGSAASLSRSDHIHPLTAPAAPANVTKAAASAGAATTVARSDHKHDISTAAAVELTDSTNAEGAATSVARSNHTHSHGNRGGGSLHAVVAGGGAAGFMSEADKTILDQLNGARTHVRVYRSTAQTIASGTPTTVVFPTVVYDQLTEYSAGTGIFTALAAGKYLVTAGADFALAAHVSGDRVVIYLSLNGTAYSNGSYDIASASTTKIMGSRLATVVSLAIGDNLRITVSPSGGPWDLEAAAASNYFTIDRLL